MTTTTYVQGLLEKYGETIKEEVNVKKVSVLEGDQGVTIQYIPLGKTLGGTFGKDTGRIIGSAKQGNATLNEDGTLLVEQGSDHWTLSPEQFEVRYSGFDGQNQIVEDGVMIELDLELSDDLIQEGVAREISRFLNQMRKDAGYDVSDRVTCRYVSESDRLLAVVEAYSEYLKKEALLQSLSGGDIDHDFSATFEYEGDTLLFYMKK